MKRMQAFLVGRRALFAVTMALALAGSASPLAAAAADPCEGFPQNRRLTRLGGAKAFAQPVADVAGLQAAVARLETDIRQVLAAEGQGHWADALLAAIRAGDVTERPLARGEKLRWMAYRPAGVAQSFGPACVDVRKPYDAFEVTVVHEEVIAPPAPACALKVNRDCQGRLAVDAAGSSPGVKVTLGGATLVPNPTSQTSWSGPDSEREADLSFSVSASTQGSTRRTTATFVIPKICLNVSLASVSDPVRGTGETASCAKTVAVEGCVLPPTCSITLTPAQGKRKEPVGLVVSHTGTEPVEVRLALTDEEGNALSEPAVSAPSSTLVFTRRGLYTVTGTARNAAGEAQCKAAVTVGRPGEGGWTVRPFAARLDPKRDEFASDAVLPGPIQERQSYGLEPGPGAGVQVERRFNPRLGLGFGLLWGQLDSSYMLDLNADWARATDEVGLVSLDLGLNLHLTPDSRVDLFVGPLLSWVQYDDGTYSALGRTFRTDFASELGFGAQVGLDVPFKEEGPWGLFAGLRYMDLSAEDEVNDFELGLDPLTFTLGLAYDF